MFLTTWEVSRDIVGVHGKEAPLILLALHMKRLRKPFILSRNIWSNVAQGITALRARRLEYYELASSAVSLVGLSQYCS